MLADVAIKGVVDNSIGDCDGVDTSFCLSGVLVVDIDICEVFGEPYASIGEGDVCRNAIGILDAENPAVDL